MVGISQQVIFGAPERIKAVLARSGWQINTAFVERLNLAFRGHLATLARRTIGRAKTEAGLIRQAQLWRAYYNFCLRATRSLETGRETGGRAARS